MESERNKLSKKANSSKVGFLKVGSNYYMHVFMHASGSSVSACY